MTVPSPEEQEWAGPEALCPGWLEDEAPDGEVPGDSADPDCATHAYERLQSALCQEGLPPTLDCSAEPRTGWGHGGGGAVPGWGQGGGQELGWRWGNGARLGHGGGRDSVMGSVPGWGHERGRDSDVGAAPGWDRGVARIRVATGIWFQARDTGGLGAPSHTGVLGAAWRQGPHPGAVNPSLSGRIWPSGHDRLHPGLPHPLPACPAGRRHPLPRWVRSPCPHPA